MTSKATLQRAVSISHGPTSDFDLNPAFRPSSEKPLRQAGVLVPVMALDGRPSVLLTKRAPMLKHHPGQIAFPGGRVDPTDADAIDAALREADEEVGLPRTSVEVLGTLPVHETVTGFAVTPVLGWIGDSFDPRPEPGEVAEVFAVPLSHLLSPSSYSIQSRIWRGQTRQFFTVPYGPYYIWGATARMLRVLADLVERA